MDGNLYAFSNMDVFSMFFSPKTDSLVLVEYVFGFLLFLTC